MELLLFFSSMIAFKFFSSSWSLSSIASYSSLRVSTISSCFFFLVVLHGVFSGKKLLNDGVAIRIYSHMHIVSHQVMWRWVQFLRCTKQRALLLCWKDWFCILKTSCQSCSDFSLSWYCLNTYVLPFVSAQHTPKRALSLTWCCINCTISAKTILFSTIFFYS
jgi:hypothetical protein